MRELVNCLAFEVVIALIILGNFVSSAIQTQKDSKGSRFLGLLEAFYFSIFVIEIGLKILAYGLIFRRGAYLRNPWNILDIAVVSATASSLITSQNNGSGRPLNFCGLRILRGLSFIQINAPIMKLRIMVGALIESIPYLVDILIIILFTMSIFAIIGLQLFRGSLQYRCFNLLEGKFSPQNSSISTCGGTRQCPEGFVCASSGYNPRSGILNFDDFFNSLFMVLMIVTLEGWSYVNTLLASSSSGYSIIYCICVILLISFFLVNLILAIITVKLSEEKSKKEKELSESQKGYLL